MGLEPCGPPPLLDQDEVEEEGGGGGGEEEEGEWEDWLVNDGEEDEYVCLFCPARFSSMQLLFRHCSSQHAFDFPQLRKDLALGFYDCLRLINFIRSQVACNTCWICGLVQGSQDALLQHVKSVNHAEDVFCKEGSRSVDQEHVLNSKHTWQDDKYLTPFLENDSLLYSFEDDSENDVLEEKLSPEDVEMLLNDSEVKNLILTASNGMADKDFNMVNDGVKSLILDDLKTTETFVSRGNDKPESSNGTVQVEIENGSTTPQETDVATFNAHVLKKKKQSNRLKVSFAEVAVRERYSINQSYFGSYSTFGIHREMLSDKIRTDAYKNAITQNPLLLEGAVVMDLGCGTGILSLFAAKAGAKKVIAVDGSKRMSLVAQQVAKTNGFLKDQGKECKTGGVINVVQGMIEELDLGDLIECNGVDVLVSEWMGYCLLFESMLDSVLFARNRWLKPGGAILPDVAEMFIAGFGVGGTSMPFWENVYGFDMKCIGREVLEDAASSLIVDVVEGKDIVTDTCLLQAFDLVTMTESDVDFTASFELNPHKGCLQESAVHTPNCTGNAAQENDECIWCYGLVVWFDTRFTSRFCREHPVLLSTSPFTPKTHWSQTLLTFHEPVCLSVSRTPISVQHTAKSDKPGTAASPAVTLKGRISIARSSRYRSIDISLETVAVGASGATQDWPVQIFDL